MTEEQKYVIRLNVRHPDWACATITDGLMLEPDGAFEKGQMISAGQAHKTATWYVDHKVKGRRHFVAEIVAIADWLDARKAFVLSLLEEGSIRIDVQLAGGRNIGDVLEPDLLRRLSDWGIALGIEVFPEMDF